MMPVEKEEKKRKCQKKKNANLPVETMPKLSYNQLYFKT